MTSPHEMDAVPRVSVITIFHNEERYLREAVDSVLSQDFEQFELLLVDDGSTDSSSAIAKQYARVDGRVRYLEHPHHSNRGMSAARNLGLRGARGEFVAFIDADDRWRPSKLREQLQLLDSLPEVHAVGGAVNYWSSHSGGKDRILATGHIRNRAIAAGEATLALYPLGRAHAPSMSDLMFRRSAIRDVGGFEEAFTGAYEDQAFLAKFYLSSTLFITDTVWSDYRIHPNSCMARTHRSGNYRQARGTFLRWFERHWSGSDKWNDPRIRRALDRALRPYGTVSGRIAGAARAVPLAVPMVRAARAAARRLNVFVAPGPAIMMYHRIADESFDPWGLAVSPAAFAEQLEWIAQNRTPLPLAQFADLHRQGRLPDNAVAVTFDDGYACNCDVAAPLLERFGIPATIFLPTDLIQCGREFWWDALGNIVLSHHGEKLSLDTVEVYLGPRQAEDEEWRGNAPPRTRRQAAYRELWSLLYERTQEELERGMKRLRQQAQLTEKPRKSHRPMSREELSGIRSDLIDFGSHSLSHASLPHLSRDEKAREIRDSINHCIQLTEAKPLTFAYPYGDFDDESERLVEEAGFLCACRADGSFVRRKTSRFAFPRIFVGNWDSARLAKELGGRL